MPLQRVDFELTARHESRSAGLPSLLQAGNEHWMVCRLLEGRALSAEPRQSALLAEKHRLHVLLLTTPPGQAARKLIVRHRGSMANRALMGALIPVTELGLLTTGPVTPTALRFVVAVPLLLLCVPGRQPLPWRALPRVAGLTTRQSQSDHPGTAVFIA